MSSMIVYYLWVHNNIDSWGRLLLLLFLLWWIVVWHCYYSLLVKLWLSELTSWLMIKRLTGAKMILSLIPYSSSSSSSSGCRLVIIFSIIVILATWWDCCSGWINIFMIDITSIASILLDIRGIQYTRRKVKGLSPLFLKTCDCQ